MNNNYSTDFLDNIRSKIRLSEIFLQKTSVKKLGRDMFAICPFHHEKTPSCKVDDSKGFFYCFGCGATGDCIDFVQKTENLSFPEAVEKLASLAGIEIPQNAKSLVNNDYIKSAYDMLNQTTQWYHKNLLSTEEGKIAFQYLLSRGISSEMIDFFQIGYAPTKDKLTYKHLNSLGYQAKIQQEFGSTNKGLFDRFSGRIIFPINDIKGRVVGFGGRVFQDELSAKYINSQDSYLFHKKSLLYNFHNARQESLDLPLIVCEGYMDVISLKKAGITKCVAPLGTAISEEQIISCWKICNDPIIMLDGDIAGLRAVDRLIERIIPFLRPNYSLRFCLLPKNEDPDSMVSSGRTSQLLDLMSNPKSMLDMIWSTHAKDVNTPEELAGIKNNLRTTLNKIVNIDVRQSYQQTVLSMFNEYSKHTIAKKIKKRPLKTKITLKNIKNIDNIQIAKKILLAIIINHPNILNRVESDFQKLLNNNSDIEKIGERILFHFHNGLTDSQEMLQKLGSDGHDLEWLDDELANCRSSKDEELSEETIFYNRWIEIWNKVFVEKDIENEIRQLANRLKICFSEADWEKLKALKQCINNNTN